MNGKLGKILAAVSIVAVLVLFGWLASKVQGLPANGRPYVLNVVDYTYTVTVWSDGSLDATCPQELDERSARSLYDRIVKAAAAERRGRRTIAAKNGPEQKPTATPAPRAKPISKRDRCQALASSTKLQCRNLAKTGKRYCNLHSAD